MTSIRASVVASIVCAGALAHADPGPRPDPAVAVETAARAFVSTLAAGTDDAIEVSFASTVKLGKLAFATDECRKAFAKKKSIKRGRAQLARCLFDDGVVPDAATMAVTVVAAGKAWDAELGELTFRFRRHGDAYLIEQIRPPARVALFSDKNKLVLDAVIQNLDGAKLEGLGPAMGTGTGTGTTTGSHGHGTGAGDNVDGDFVSHGTGHGTGGTASTAAEVNVATGEPAGDFGGLTAEQINRVVRSRAGVFRACYQKQLSKTKDLAGKAVIRFEVAADGHVSSATVKSKLGDALDDCLASNILRLKFPATTTTSVISYPFVFSH